MFIDHISDFETWALFAKVSTRQTLIFYIPIESRYGALFYNAHLTKVSREATERSYVRASKLYSKIISFPSIIM